MTDISFHLVWHWPQIAILVCFGLDLAVFAYLHGTPRTDKFSLTYKIFDVGLTAVLLYYGGFFLGNAP